MQYFFIIANEIKTKGTFYLKYNKISTSHFISNHF